MMKLFAEERRNFPDPRAALDEGIVDVGDHLSVETLLEAYSFGIFPWPHEGFPTLWFSPPYRGVLDFADLHLPTSFRKFLNKTDFQVSFNQCFADVIEACSFVPRPGQQGTWITPQLKDAYVAFHEAGYAHSVECWSGDELVGGLYGVYVGGVFCGESMFYKRDNASKFALWKLIENLKANELTWLDIQMVTPHLAGWGGKYISRQQFLRRLEQAKQKARPLEFKNLKTGSQKC